jgi:hypothetical protein
MGDILDLEHGGLVWEYETQTHGGNNLWAQPEEARAAGAAILQQLVRHYGVTPERNDGSGTPEMPDEMPEMVAHLFSAVGYAGLPTERRVHIISGFIQAAAETGILGGDPEWAGAET